MPGAHVPGERRAARWLGPRARARRGAPGVGWWQPPPPKDRPAGAHRSRRAFALTAALAVLGPLAALAPGYLIIDLPGPDDVVRGSAALISYADGEELARLAPAPGARPRLRPGALPAHVRDAVLAVRDPDFGSRPAVDPTGILRAVTGPGPAPDAGPVANQLAGRALAGFAPTPWRAYREVVLVSKLSVQRDHDQLLTDYLDSVHLGRGSYGLAQGAVEYFGADPAELTLEQGALLAALIGAPWSADPAFDPSGARRRWAGVLDAMVGRGWLAPARRAAARFPDTLPRRVDAGLPADDRAPAVAAVLTELARLGFTETQLAEGGLRVATTLDPVRQHRAAAVAAQAEATTTAAVGIVALDPATGGVLAYRGGPDAVHPDATRLPAPAGPAFAPFVLLAGQLQDPPVGPADVADAGPPTHPADDDCPACATGDTLARLSLRVGPDAVAGAAVAAGLAPAAGGAPTADAFGLASAYATLAAGGTRRAPHLVESVSTTDGRVLYRAEHPAAPRFPEPAVRAALSTARQLALPGGDVVAAGSGTGVAAAVRVVVTAGVDGGDDPGPAAADVLAELIGRRAGPR
ncbi:biosynthetic peptidoglycan transglycosylase [Pseudonocardia humida]|uniref:Penicillin-binding protein n=1 Tax=Pseudonocardia humida TaxID=2800819 RepID=A0ABT0ZRY6_9PSEU|nr:biosynthetic peptidoglycan transglycosylase [Pseudonocardia humida]MCO1653486.1 penicillin-binding protein [Pseudonocardia humida]